MISPVGAVTTSEETIVRALADLIARLRKSADAETGARVFLLGHLQRLGPQRMSDLAAKACLDQSTVSRHLRHLEDQGLVDRSPDPDDRRATLLALSDGGVAALDRAVQARADLIRSATADWSDADRQALAHLISRLAHDLEPVS